MSERVPDSEPDGQDKPDALKKHRLGVLREAGFNKRQRETLLERIETNEILLKDVTRLFDKGASVEQAWWILS